MLLGRNGCDENCQPVDVQIHPGHAVALDEAQDCRAEHGLEETGHAFRVLGADVDVVVGVGVRGSGHLIRLLEWEFPVNPTIPTTRPAPMRGRFFQAAIRYPYLTPPIVALEWP